MYKPFRGKSGGGSGGYQGRKDFGGKPPWKKDFGGRSDRGPVELFETVCSQCHDACRVPFKPNGRKPVLCNNCFRKEGGNERSDRPSFREDRPSYGSDRPSYRPPSGGDNSQVESRLKRIEEKLDAILEMLESEE